MIKSVKEVIQVEVQNGYRNDAFDKRIAQLLEDPTVSEIVGPVIICTGSNPAGNYADYNYTIWYRQND